MLIEDGVDSHSTRRTTSRASLRCCTAHSKSIRLLPTSFHGPSGRARVRSIRKFLGCSILDSISFDNPPTQNDPIVRCFRTMGDVNRSNDHLRDGDNRGGVRCILGGEISPTILVEDSFDFFQTSLQCLQGVKFLTGRIR